jgi:hypothetical protein
MSLRRGRDDPSDIRFEERQERVAEDRDEHAPVSYMDEDVPECEHCGFQGTRREMIVHIHDPCPGLRASQLEGERIIRMINAQQERDPEPF